VERQTEVFLFLSLVFAGEYSLNFEVRPLRDFQGRWQTQFLVLLVFLVPFREHS
jgi:hypothetical protein